MGHWASIPYSFKEDAVSPHGSRGRYPSMRYSRCPTPWLSQPYTRIHREYQEPGSTPSTTHTIAYLQKHASSSHGVPEHDRASGMSAPHGCGHPMVLILFNTFVTHTHSTHKSRSGTPNTHRRQANNKQNTKQRVLAMPLDDPVHPTQHTRTSPGVPKPCL